MSPLDHGIADLLSDIEYQLSRAHEAVAKAAGKMAVLQAIVSAGALSPSSCQPPTPESLDSLIPGLAPSGAASSSGNQGQGEPEFPQAETLETPSASPPLGSGLSGNSPASTEDMLDLRVGATVMLVRLPFTPRVKQILNLAEKSAIESGDTYVGPKHLMLGIHGMLSKKSD